MRVAVAVAALAGLAACAAPIGTRVAGPSIVSALETQSDGFAGVTQSGERFEIVSTSVSQSRLCRVVSIDGGSRFEVESFCKAPGGSWR